MDRVRVRFGPLVAEVAAVAFDKDGLLIDKRRFLSRLQAAREAALGALLADGQLGVPPAVRARLLRRWRTRVGVRSGPGEPLEVDPEGPLAVAPPAEEAVLLAGTLYERLRWPWPRCLATAREVFTRANEAIDPAGHPMPGFPDVLQRLTRAGVPWGIVSSDEPERVRALLDRYGLSPHCRFLVTARDVTRAKPEPEMLEVAARHLGVPTTELAMVGDSPVDVEMARRAGALAVAVPYPGEERLLHKLRAFAHVVLSSLHEIEAVG